MSVKYVEGGEELLDKVNPLWKKLNEHHVGISTFFKDDLSKRTFNQRNEQWVKNAKQGFLRIDLAIPIIKVYQIRGFLELLSALSF